MREKEPLIVRKLEPNSLVQLSRRQLSLHSSLWESEISPHFSKKVVFPGRTTAVINISAASYWHCAK
jgi:hypothetical protein